MDYVEGLELTWPYFISTTKNFDILKKLIKNNDFSKVIIFEILIDSNNSWNKFDISEISLYKQTEQEVLIYPNFCFKVLKSEPIQY